MNDPFLRLLARALDLAVTALAIATGSMLAHLLLR